MQGYISNWYFEINLNIWFQSSICNCQDIKLSCIVSCFLSRERVFARDKLDLLLKIFCKNIKHDYCFNLHSIQIKKFESQAWMTWAVIERYYRYYLKSTLAYKGINNLKRLFTKYQNWSLKSDWRHILRKVASIKIEKCSLWCRWNCKKALLFVTYKMCFNMLKCWLPNLNVFSNTISHMV